MAQQDFFPSRPFSNPQIYAYSDVNYKGLLKVGYTAKDVEGRIADQYPVKLPNGKPYRIELVERAMRNDGTSFMDHDVHKWLRKHGIQNPEGDWFKCTVSDVRSAIYAVKSRTENEENRSETFGMRPEQERAVKMTAEYFRDYKKTTHGKTPHFLWNCKMRFGKTFATYQLAKRMGWKKVLVLTFKPAVQSAWEEDLKSHVDFEGWQFVSRDSELNGEDVGSSRPVVCFGSFQDFLGKNKVGGIKAKNEWVHLTNWDCVVLDEYHYGAWRDNAKDLFYDEEERKAQSAETYFQAAFRVQTPWTAKDEKGKTEILKKECYVFDFAPDRALKQIADYACRLNVNETQPEKKVEDFINFLPVLAYDGSHMKQIDAAGILDIAMSGTSATLLARRWESALLVNVDNDTLRRLMDSPDAMKALMSIEGFRNLNKDIETIINKSESVKNKKEKANEKDLTPKEKRELSKKRRR